MDQKIALSDCIVEGEVTSQSTFRNRTDGYIYTNNKIKLSKILYGQNQISSDTVSVLTRGGVYEESVETWTHLLQLNTGEYGIFFLNPSEEPNSYTVFSGAQGFIRFSDHGVNGISARDVMTTYKNVREEVYQKIANTTNHNVKSIPTFNEDNANCLKISLVPIINNSFEELIYLNFDLRLAMEKQNRYLKEIKFRIRYDTDILGSNIIMNDVLNVGLSEHILEGHYQLDVSDLQENVVEIKLNTTESASILLDQFYQSILRLQLDASSLSAIPDFELINQGFQESIRLINPITNEEESPDCIRPEFPILERVCPVITSISPDTVAAGVLGRSLNNIPGEITIRGSGFGDPNPGFRKPHESDVSFYDPDGGFFEAGELEYISWSDTIIRVNVPTRSKNTNTTTSGAQDLSLGASTNKIKLFTKKFDPLTGLCSDTCTIFSQDSLFVHFGMFNDAFSEQFQNIEICSTQFQNIIAVGGERRNLVNRNNLGGYSFYIDTLLYTNPVMQDSIVSQITQGIDFFRCNYKFHFTQVAQGLAPNGISRDAGLAFGTLATTLGMGESISNSCGASVQADNPISQFSIKINAMVLDELAVPDMFGNPTNTKFKFSLTDTFQPDSTYTDSISGFNILLRDFRKIFLHEMGHIIQLRHTNNPNDLMAAGAINTSTREVSANDILGIEHAYLLSKEGTCFGGPMDDWKPCTTSAHSKLSNISDLKIQPNPTNSLLHISPSVTSGEIVIYNLLGAIVWQENFSSVLEDLNINLPSQIQPSTYILVVKNKKGNIVQAGKFIKIK